MVNGRLSRAHPLAIEIRAGGKCARFPLHRKPNSIAVCNEPSQPRHRLWVEWLIFVFHFSRTTSAGGYIYGVWLLQFSATNSTAQPLRSQHPKRTRIHVSQALRVSRPV